MALKTKSIRGTRDVPPPDTHKWQYIERTALETARAYGFTELRTPTIEKTELFVRSVGETTDVVQKEMYTFEKSSESITLRPEGTAGTVRAVLENSLLAEALPVKVCYLINCFRHERPQAGRLREFHQFGVEAFGSASPSADAEVIDVARAFLLDRLGLSGIELQINSIGCPKCRPAYNQKLVEYYRGRIGDICPTCRERMEKNPLRLLDCKEERCAPIAKDAPKILGHLCGECADHFDGLRTRLDAMGISYDVNPAIVRGLDYYTKTVFEFVSGDIGAQSAVCGGGRYDLLVEHMGGPPTPALGFAMGMERLLLAMESCGAPFPEQARCDLYIGSMGETENIRALELCGALRAEGFCAECDLMGRSVKAQMKYADKLGAAHACVIGSNELEQGSIAVKNMRVGGSVSVPLTASGLSGYLNRRSAGEAPARMMEDK